jgi:hypothetical protein
VIQSILRVALGALLLVSLPMGVALAYDAADSDAFFLELGHANIELRDSTELISGSSVRGGVRIGLFWTVFAELGYGAVTYNDEATVLGVKENIDFRTTGANLGLGFLIPIRNLRIGFKAERSPNNRWSEIITDTQTQTQLSAMKGNINFDSYQAFVLIGRYFELGARRDQIRSTSSVLTNSFGPYLALNIPL